MPTFALPRKVRAAPALSGKQPQKEEFSIWWFFLPRLALVANANRWAAAYQRRSNTMNKLTDWIKRHQVAAFFIITFAISWGLGFSWGAVLKRNQFLLLPLAFVATCGPGLAGIIVTAVTNTQPRQGPRKTFWIAFLVAWFVSALVCLANLKFIEHSSLSPAAIGLFTISGSAGCLCDRFGLFPHSGSEKLPGFVDPAAWRVGLVYPWLGIVPHLAFDFLTHQ